MLNTLFVALIAVAVLTGAYRGTMPALTDAGIQQAKAAVDLSIALIGQMALWLGFMGVLKEAGLLAGLARALKPVMSRLFPDVPPEHPAMGAMILNIAANMLGLGNAATPFGLKAMGELNTLNPRPGVATDAMILFLVINTSGVAVLPLGAVAVRATLGSRDAAGIMIPSIVGTFISTVASVLLFKLIQRWASPVVSSVQAGAVSPLAEVKGLEEAQALAAERPPPPLWRTFVVLAVSVALLALVARHLALAPGTPLETLRAVFSGWLLPVLMLAIVLVGFWREVRVYEAFIAAAKEGFQVGVLIIPYLVAILVAVGLFRASGAMEAFTSVVGPYTALVGLPAEALPMALVRPLSGNGALGVMTETMKVHGPDSFIGYLVSLINGSSETTFYVLALYFGSVQVRATRYALAACLTSDAIGLAITVALAHLFF